MKKYIIDVEESSEQELLGYLTILDGNKVKFSHLKKELNDANGRTFVTNRNGNGIARNQPSKEEIAKKEYVNRINREGEERTEKERESNPRTKTYPVYRYKNYSRKSGVYAYAYSPDNTVIYIYFKGKRRGWYKYDIYSAPRWMIETMIKRAKSGWGLNRFVNKHPKTYYWKGTY